MMLSFRNITKFNYLSQKILLKIIPKNPSYFSYLLFLVFLAVPGSDYKAEAEGSRPKPSVRPRLRQGHHAAAAPHQRRHQVPAPRLPADRVRDGVGLGAGSKDQKGNEGRGQGKKVILKKSFEAEEVFISVFVQLFSNRSLPSRTDSLLLPPRPVANPART